MKDSKPRKTIKILGKTYNIAWLDALPGALGACSKDMLQIYMQKGSPQDIVESTMLHEAMEAIIDELNIKLEHDDLERLDVGVYAVLRDQGVDLRPLVEERS